MTGEAVTHTEARAQSAPPIYFEEVSGGAENQTLSAAAAFMLVTEAGANHMDNNTTDGEPERKLKYTVKEAAAILGVSPWTVRRYFDNGLLEGYEADGKHRGYVRGEAVRQRILWLSGRSVRALVDSKPRRGRKVDAARDTEKRQKWRVAQKISRDKKKQALEAGQAVEEPKPRKSRKSRKRAAKRAATGRSGSKSTAARRRRK